MDNSSKSKSKKAMDFNEYYDELDERDDFSEME